MSTSLSNTVYLNDKPQRSTGIPGPLALNSSHLPQLTDSQEKLTIKPEDSSVSDVTKSSNGTDSQKKNPLLQTQRENIKIDFSGISEFSHHAHDMKIVAEKAEEEEEEAEWKSMPSYAPYDIYDDDNRLIAMEKVESDDDEDRGNADRGYTRVQMDDDVQSVTSLDENTQYLFKDVNGTCAGEIENEEPRDTVSQMRATKGLLTEGQRIAYVGMTKVILSTMIKQSENMALSENPKKETTNAYESMKMWGQKMMMRLYAHMEISSAEQVMIEQLSEHNVTPSDLTPTLMQNSRVKNPMVNMDQLDSELTDVKSSTPSAQSRFSVLSPGPSKFDLHTDESLPALPPYKEHEGDDLPEVRTPSQLPRTANLDIDLRWTVLCDLFLTLIADSLYDARSRTLLEKVGDNMGVDWLEICKFEKRVTDALEMQQQTEKDNLNDETHKENRRKMALKKRYVMMGLATVGGSLVIGLSAGLLAPVIGAGLAAGFSTIGVAGTGGFLAGTGGAAIITSGAAASGGIIAVRAADRRTGAVKTFEYRPLHNNRRVNLIITISGWMTGKVDDVRLPYSTVNPIMGDIYSVLWEPEMLRSMGDTINILATEVRYSYIRKRILLTSKALTQGLQQVLGSTILISLMAALQLPVILTKLAYLIDNPWTVSLDRANSAGLILADSLISRNLGTRPITFVGYSLGSRVIFSCLKELSKKGAYGLVQNVYLFGSPIVVKKDEYLKARSVVAGRFVNGYATNDWILGYLFRLTSGGISRVAGLAPVENIPSMENIDVTELVPGHMSYRRAMPRLLRKVGWVVESDEFDEIEDPDPDNHQERQRQLINEIEEARKDLEKKNKDKESKGKFGFFSRKKKIAVSKADWETYEESRGDSKHSPNHVEDEPRSNSQGLFDIQAIRAELLSEQVEIRELKSTLPPMKLDLAKLNTSSLGSLEPQNKGQQSMLIRSSKFCVTNQTDKSVKLGSPFSAHDRKISNLPRYISGYQENLETRCDSSCLTLSKDSSDSKQKFTISPMGEKGTMIEVKDTTHLQTLSPGKPLEISPLEIGHNVWVDDDEFAEKEVQMTFA